jgi:hypothetical protein
MRRYRRSTIEGISSFRRHTVDSWWAMANVVRSSRLSLIRSSVRLSTWEVASSSRRIAKSISTTRAMALLAREFDSPLVDLRVVAIRKLREKLVSVSNLGCFRDCCLIGLGSPYAMFS